MPTPRFFERLGIAPTQDRTLIKRAYATALKTIDQQQEREAFETLRRAYEQALAWDAEADDNAFTGDASTDDDDASPDNESADNDREAGAPDADEDDHGGEPPTRIDHWDPAPPPISPFTPPAPPPPYRDPEREDLAASHAAMHDWIARLVDARPEIVDALLDDALKDPRLGHLDSQSQFEAYLADTLYNHPAERLLLFQAASRRFGWTDRNARPGGSPAAQDWITRVINQELQWHDQAPAAVGGQNVAIQAAMQTDTPAKSLAHRFAPVLADIQERFPDWLSLGLPAGRVLAWQQVYAALSPAWLRMARVRHYYLGDRRKMPGRIIVAVLLLLIAQGFARSFFNGGLFSSDPPPASAQTRAATPGAPVTPGPEPVLAYEFTGAVTQDSCDTAHEFIHESNWLEINDPAAIALLTTRVLLCRQFKQWPQADDPLLACLRDERLAALTDARAEDPPRCAALTRPKK